MTQRIPMTEDGLKKLKEKLTQLKEVERPHVERRLGEAREQGDLSENAAFSAAREELWNVDRHIAELEDQLSRVEVISSKRINVLEVAFGAHVKVKDKDSDFIDEYYLVGEGESNLAENKIAITTPIGQGLLGHKLGDIVSIKIPAGVITYEITEISYNS